MAKESAVADVLNLALDTWNENRDTMFSLLTESPENFRGGAVWERILSLSDTLTAAGYALMVLFFLTGVFRTVTSLEHLRRPETALRLLVKFSCAKVLVSRSGEIMLAMIKIVTGITSMAVSALGSAGLTDTVLPSEIEKAASDANFLQSVPLFAVSLIAALAVWILSVKMILTVYGRFFRIYVYTALAPLPMSALAGDGTDRYAYNFLRSFASVLLEGLLMAVSVIIWSFFASSAPEVAAGETAAKMVWKYMGSLIFNLLILDVLIRSSDRAVKEMIF